MQSSLDAFIPSQSPRPEPVSTSQEVRDRGSIFVANIFTATSVKQAKDATAHLRNVLHVAKPASHELSAWRCMVLKRGKTGLGGEDDFQVISGYDDDGEKWGGERILKVMKATGVIDAVVVVSRWYGGIMLGPARFTHIETCADEVCRKFKLKEDVAECTTMLASLDDILASLRAEYATYSTEPTSMAVKKKPDYSVLESTLDLVKLKRLVTARENSIKSVKQLLLKKSAETQEVKALEQ